MAEPALPVPTPETEPYWEAAMNSELLIQRGRISGGYIFPPRAVSPEVPGEPMDWVRLSGRGTLESFIVNHRPAPGITTLSPIIALIRLAEGPMLLSNIVDVDPLAHGLTLDMPLEVCFYPLGERLLPVFRPILETP